MEHHPCCLQAEDACLSPQGVAFRQCKEYEGPKAVCVVPDYETCSMQMDSPPLILLDESRNLPPSKSLLQWQRTKRSASQILAVQSSRPVLHS